MGTSSRKIYYGFVWLPGNCEKNLKFKDHKFSYDIKKLSQQVYVKILEKFTKTGVIQNLRKRVLSKIYDSGNYYPYLRFKGNKFKDNNL